MANERPWYFYDRTVILAILALLIFALPLVWLSPYYSLRRKIVVSVLTVVGTYFSIVWTVDALKILKSSMELLQ